MYREQGEVKNTTICILKDGQVIRQGRLDYKTLLDIPDALGFYEKSLEMMVLG